MTTKLRQLERKEKEKQRLVEDLLQNEEKKSSAGYDAKKNQLQKALEKANEEVDDLMYELTEEF